MKTSGPILGGFRRTLLSTGLFGHAGARLAAGLALAGAMGVGARAAEFPQGLMLHFSFEEATSGGNVSDRTGRGNNGRCTNATWTTTGRRGGGCAFGETNSFLQIVHNESLNLTQATFAVWFKTTNTDPVARTLLDKQPANGFALGLAGKTPDGKDQGRVCVTIAGHTCVGDSNVTDGVWHHAAATYNGEILKLYVDGLPQKQTAEWRGRIPTNGCDIIVGMNKSCPAPEEKGHSFWGLLDEVMIFNHAITEAEVGAVIAYAKSTFTREQVARRLAELKDLYDRGLFTQEFYDRKVRECEVSQ